MNNIMSTLLAKRAFSDILEGMNSNNCLLAPLVCSKPPFFCVNNSLSFYLIAFTVLHIL